MPYIRLYSKDISLEEKRQIAEKLISIALRAFELHPEERYKVSVQFLPRKLSPAPIHSLFRSEKAAAVLEVSDHDLTVHHITAFVQEATPLLSQPAVVGQMRRLAHMLGLRPDPSRQIAFQFNDPGPAAKTVRDEYFAPIPLRKAA